MKNKINKSFIISLLSLWIFSGAGIPSLVAQEPYYKTVNPSSEYASAIRYGHRLVDSLMRAQDIPGLEIAVSVRGQTVWAEGFGYADLENKVPVWPYTKMRVGSIAKSFTSVAVGILMEGGKLNIDAPVRTYVPYWPKKKYTITTRQLAGHLAGIRHYRDDEFLSAKHYNSLKEGLKIFMYDSLLFKPGTDYHYSSYGWNLIGAVIEGACGCNYLSYMQTHVFDPLQMTQTVAGLKKPIIHHRSSFYKLNDAGKIVNAPYVDNSYKWPSGGYLSTVIDLLKFGNAMLDYELLSKKTTHLLWTSQKTTGGMVTHHGMGWHIGNDSQGYHWVGHSGGSVGGSTEFIIYPSHHVVIAIVSNLSDVEYNGIQFRIADKFIAVESVEY